MDLEKYTDKHGAMELIARFDGEFAVVENPEYIYPPYDLYPLAQRSDELYDGMAGAVMDMDGTTTTTEPLCLHSLETMVRRIAGHETDPTWKGLDRERDYPHIIGNSTTRHVEYLIRTYKDSIDEAAMRYFYVYSAIWTLGQGVDEGRKRQVRSNCAAMGIGGLPADARFEGLQGADSLDTPEARQAIERLTKDAAGGMRLTTLSDKVRAAVDIYYQRYHFILKRIDAGQGDAVAAEVFGDPDKHLIRPMKGTGVFLAMLKGWLGADAAFCFDEFAEHLSRMGMDRPRRDERTSRAQLAALGAYFERNPAAVAVVTSSILYEADIVLSEVFRVLAREVAAWDIPSEKSRLIANRFAEYSRCYDAFITASDSSEIRLKPHRDLYSMALHAMGIPPESFHRVAGFEDSESGTIAIRASGIPLCCALPFPETEGHDFKAASYVARGGIPEVVLSKRVFLPDRLITE